MELSDGSLVADLRAENAALKQQLEGQLLARQPAGTDMKNVGWEGCGLNSSQVSRYSRQLVLPSFGPQGMLMLANLANLCALRPIKCHSCPWCDASTIDA